MAKQAELYERFLALHQPYCIVHRRLEIHWLDTFATPRAIVSESHALTDRRRHVRQLGFCNGEARLVNDARHAIHHARTLGFG
jgi:hypothetical protein